MEYVSGSSSKPGFSPQLTMKVRTPSASISCLCFSRAMSSSPGSSSLSNAAAGFGCVRMRA